MLFENISIHCEKGHCWKLWNNYHCCAICRTKL